MATPTTTWTRKFLASCTERARGHEKTASGGATLKGSECGGMATERMDALCCSLAQTVEAAAPGLKYVARDGRSVDGMCRPSWQRRGYSRTYSPDPEPPGTFFFLFFIKRKTKREKEVSQ